MPFKPKVILIGILLAVLAALAYFTVSGIYNAGVNSAQHKCLQDKVQYQEDLANNIREIESSLTSLAKNATTREEILANDINEILRRVKKSPVVVVKDGKCIPSQTFVDGINSAINRTNSK